MNWLINFVGLFISCTFAQQCQIVRRPEIRELSMEQRQKFFSAVQKLPKNTFVSNTNIHLNYQREAHGVPAFLPWHREYLARYERELQKIDSSIILPYWDWSKDAQAPERSPILSDSFFGGNGRLSDNCISDGQFAFWQMAAPNKHCLKRRFDGENNTISSFYSAEALEVILRSNSYNEFRTTLEGAPHGRVHVSIGGDLGTMHSPNDPLFFMHHAFIDLLWHEWQWRHPQIALTYNGDRSFPVNSRDVLQAFKVPVSRALDTRNYCYNYARWNVKLPNVKSKSFSTFSYLNLKKYIPPTDRQEPFLLRSPLPLPEAYLRRNFLNPSCVRSSEKSLNNIIEQFNSIPDFRPKFGLNFPLTSVEIIPSIELEWPFNYPY